VPVAGAGAKDALAVVVVVVVAVVVVAEGGVNGTNDETPACDVEVAAVTSAVLGAPEASANSPVFMLRDRDSPGGSIPSFSGCTWC
jgi:hypothetical protein